MTVLERWTAFRAHGGLSRQVWPILLGLVLPLLFAWRELARLGVYTVDDAYISFRYAENLVNGHGLVYNVGERVEGFTNLLWTLLLAGAYGAGGSTLFASKVLGVLGATGAIVLAFAFATRMYREESAGQGVDASRAFPPLCLSTWALATSSAFLAHSIIGLETGSFAFLTMWGLWLLQAERDQEQRGQNSKPWSALVFCAACLTRPEAPLFFGASMLFMRTDPASPAHVPGRWRKLRELAAPASLFCFVSLLASFIVLHQSRAPAMRLAALAWLALSGLALAAFNVRALLTRFVLIRVSMVLALLVALTAFRLGYYGAFIPNTFSAKTGNPSDELMGGVTYLRNFFRLTQPLPYVALVGLGAGLWQRRPLALTATALSLGGLAYILRVGSDWMPFFRYLVPFMPFMLLLAESAFQRVLAARSRALTVGLALACLTFCLARNLDLAQDRFQLVVKDKSHWDKAAGGVARWLEVYGGPGSIALGDIGEIGYRSDRVVFDILGLVTREVSALPGGYGGKEVAGLREAFFRAAPRYMVVISKQDDCEHPFHHVITSIYNDPRFSIQYAASGRVRSGGNTSWCLYERRSFMNEVPAAPREVPSKG